MSDHDKLIEQYQQQGFDLESAFARMAGMTDIYAESAQIFLVNIGKLRDKIIEDLQHNAYKSAALHFHTLKGSAMTLGAIDFAEYCRNSQQFLQTQTEVNTAEFLNTVDEQIHQTAEKLQALITQLS